MHNKTKMAISFGFKWNISLSQGITRVISCRTDLLYLHLDNSELRLDLSATREHANTYINFKTPLMMIEKVVLRNEWRGITSLSHIQFVSTFAPRPLWLTWATMRTYRVQTYNFYNIVDCTQSHYGVHCSVEPYLWGSTLCTVCYGFNKVTLLRLKYNKEVQ